MLKNCFLVSEGGELNHRQTYSKNDQEEEVHVGDVVKLEPNVLRNETDRCILGRPDLIPPIVLGRMPIFIESFRG